MDKRQKLDELKKEMLADKTLPLRKGANNLVFGEGNPDTKALFIGEGPGYWEDMKGRPFVGNAGKFLDQLLQSIEVARKDVFITNVVFYRPPGNRDPEDSELMAFKKYIDKIIEIINPKIIVTLGRFSMGKFLPGAKITRVHGTPQTVSWKGKEFVVMPMFHPAAGLRRGEIKRQTIEDFKKLSKMLKEVGEDKEKEVEQMQLV